MNKNRTNVLINGLAADFLNINDRAIHYGDGLFETILCRANKLLYWQQHYLRLQESAETLKIECPDEQLLLEDIAVLLKADKDSFSKSCAIKIIISRGCGERGYKISNKSSANRIVLLSSVTAGYSSLLTERLLSGNLYLCQQQVSINESLAGIKHLNRLENVLARNEWDEDYIDGLMLDANKHAIEGTMSNIFTVNENKLYTADLSLSGIDGIMRDVIIALAKRNNINTVIKNLTMDSVLSMDEFFITNSLIGIKSVNTLLDTTYKKNTMTKMIFNELLKTMDDYAQAV